MGIGESGKGGMLNMAQVEAIEELQAEGRVLEIARLFPRQGEWTEEDYFSLPESNRMIELSEGRLIISPAPTPRHQRISMSLSILFGSYIRSHKLGDVVASPTDIKLKQGVIRKPDLAFMGNEHLDRIEKGLWGVPDLVMEILSESNIEEDRKCKFKQYQNAGVSEYWIVDPFQQTVEIFTLENRAYVLFGKWGVGEIAQSKLLAGFQVIVDSVFE